MDAPGDRTVLAAFLVSALLAGGNAVGIRFSNRELDPLWGAGLRFALAAAIFTAVMAALRLELPRGRALTGAVLFGLLNFAAAFALAYYALIELHAGFGQILLAVVPLMTLMVAVLERQERLRIAAVLGGIVALGGVAVMARAPLDAGLPLLSVLAALASALCFAQAAVVVRWFPRVHPLAANAVGMTVGAVVLLAAALVFGETIELPERAATWAALAYLVAVGSVVVFALYLFVLRHWAASRSAYVFVVIPLFTVLLSAWLDEEPISAGLVLGGALVVVGVYVGALRRSAEAGAGADR